MNRDDFPSFAKFMAFIAEYYRHSLSESTLELYWKGLSRYDWKAIQQAVWHHIRMPQRGQFMPKISDVIESIEGDYQTQALQAWTKVTQAIQRMGVYQSVQFDDPLIHAVIQDMGGWIRLWALYDDDGSRTFQSPRISKAL
jgi:hypothetical protein